MNVDFPLDLLQAIDREADRIGVTRQSFIKLRLADAVAERDTQRRERLSRARAQVDPSEGSAPADSTTARRRTRKT